MAVVGPLVINLDLEVRGRLHLLADSVVCQRCHWHVVAAGYGGVRWDAGDVMRCPECLSPVERVLPDPPLIVEAEV